MTPQIRRMHHGHRVAPFLRLVDELLEDWRALPRVPFLQGGLRTAYSTSPEHDAFVARLTRARIDHGIAFGETGTTLCAFLHHSHTIGRQAFALHDERIPDVDDICWHHDQLVRGKSDLRQAAFRGPGLYDPMARRILDDMGWRDADTAEAFTRGGTAKVRIPRVHPATAAGCMSFTNARNQVRCEIGLSPSVRWTNGHITIEELDVPQTVLLSFKGRPIDEIVAHPLIAGLGLTVRSVAFSSKGKTTLGLGGIDFAPLATSVAGMWGFSGISG